MTILLAEQNAAMALGVADRAYVLESGHISLEGEAAAAELRRAPALSGRLARRSFLHLAALSGDKPAVDVLQTRFDGTGNLVYL